MALGTDRANLILSINGEQAGSTLKDLNSKARDLRRALQNLDPNTEDFRRLSAELRQVNGQIGGITSQFRNAKAEASGFSGLMQQAFGVFLGGGLLGILQMVLGGIFNLGKSAVKAAADMEGLKTAVEVFLGSGAAATKFLRDIQKFAADTPFEFPELAEAGKKLLAFGYSGDGALALLKKLGDVAAATQVPIAELAAIIGKAKLGEKIQGEELNQLADRGINVFPQLAKILNTTTDQIKKLGSEGKISYADLEKAITMATEKGGQFYGMMEKQSRTFNGLMSTLSDNFNQFVQSLFGGIGEGLKPVIAAIGNFFGQLTDLFRDGKKPVGEYAEVIQYVASLFKLLGNVFGIVWEVGKLFLGYVLEQIKAVAWLGNRIGELINWFVGLAEQAKKLPFIGLIFKSILDTVGLLSDVLSNASATFAGFRAAAQQAVTNVQTYFKALVLDAEIMGSKISAAISFNESVKKQAAQLIAAREAQKAAMFNAGKTVEQAYMEGRNAAIAAQNRAEAEAETVKKAEKEKAKAVDKKAAEKAEKDRIKRIEEARELELRAASLYYDRDLLANEVALMKKQVTESEAAEQELLIQQAKYEGLLKIQTEYLGYFKQGTEEYLKTESAILELQKKKLPIDGLLNRAPVEEVATLGKRQNTEGVKSSEKADPLAAIQLTADLEKAMVRQKFGDLLTLETEFELRRLEIQKNAYAEQRSELQQLYADKKISAADYAIKYVEIAENEKKTDADVVENKRRLSDIENEIENVKMGLKSEAFDLGIELLSADEQARKKNASAIKAFQIAQIVTDGVAEVAGIWKTSNLNALNILFPGAGEVIAGVKTAFAVGRTVAAVSRVNNQKFARGGVVQMLGGQSHANGGNTGVFEDGTTVEMERGEVLAVVNAKNAPMLKMLSKINSMGGNGVPYFEGGGLLLPNTTPNPANFFVPQYATAAPISASAATSDAILYQMLAKFDSLEKAVEKNREVKFYRNKLEDAYASDEEDRAAARWTID